ncbi:alpha/beta fold hydrolase [Leifsonia sp. LS-T14]|uniref:alpha/beta fold hydrolase n=1 Tax=unclassified Leifsonia TaxID=2663824 RepID=UPI0035A6A6FC
MVETGAGRVTVRRTPGESGARGPAVATILLHGAAGSWTTWAPLIDAAEAERGAPIGDLVIPDLPGWGDSPADVSRLDARALADAVATVARALGYRRWRLVGHSLGGFVALELAAAEPEATESVTLISATTFGARADSAGRLRLFAAYMPLMLLDAGMRVLAGLGAAGPRLIRALDRAGLLGLLVSPLFARRVPGVEHELGRDVRPRAFVRAVASARQYAAAERWGRIRCPVLAIHGDRDVFVPRGDDARLASVVPDLRTVVLPRTGHFAHVEHPSLVARLCLGGHSGEESWLVSGARASVVA